jgi:SMODS and SLOG-associating 2TM effector domain family 4
MFNLSVVDHLRLSFGHVVQSYTAHTRTADRLTARAWQIKVAVLLLVGLAAAAAVAALLGASRAYQIAAAIAAGLAFAGHAMFVGIDFDGRATAHRVCASRLWLVAERYRALLAEIHDGLVDGHGIGPRRDALLQQVQTIYEQAPPSEREAYAAAAEAVAGRRRAALSESQIDAFLPASLRKESRPEPLS